MSDIDIGVVDLNSASDDERREMAMFALSMYADEPCRICGRLLTMDDLHEGAVFAGYSPDNTSRAAHKRCWEGYLSVAKQQGQVPNALGLLDAVKLAYRKHHLEEDTIGWDELSDALKDSLCESMGDATFVAWQKLFGRHGE